MTWGTGSAEQQLTNRVDVSERAYHFRKRSLNRFLFNFSLGLVAMPSSHEITLATVTVCSSSGAFTRIVKRVPGARVISARAQCLHAAIASTAASPD
jgi:hypothetical protein